MAKFIQNSALSKRLSTLKEMRYGDFQKFLASDRVYDEWVGVSFQHNNIDYASSFQSVFDPSINNDFVVLLDQLVSIIDENEDWIVFHAKRQFGWVTTNKGAINEFDKIAEIIKNNGNGKEQFGALVLNSSELKRLALGIIYYPAFIRHRDIVLLQKSSCSAILISHHFTIDLISNNGVDLNENISKIKTTKFKPVSYL